MSGCAWSRPRALRPLGALLVLAAILVPAAALAQTARISVDLALTSGPAIAGTNLTFTITANNEGPNDAANASLTFAVPTNSTFVSLVTPAGWVCAPPLPPGGTGSTTCTKPTFVLGSEVFTLTVATSPSAPAGTSVKLNASITSTTNDPNQNDNTNQIEVLLIRQSTLAMTKTGPASAFAGAVITYTISINNTGPSFASGPTVNDTFTAPLRFVGVTAPGWSCATPPIGSPGTVSCTNPEIPVGITNLTLRLDTSPSTSPTSVTNNVGVSASTDPAGPRMASATTSITASADLTITKTAAPPAPLPGQMLTYTITVTQNGPSDAANVTVTDALPSAVLFQSITASGWTCTTPAVGTSGTVSCTRTPLAPGSYPMTIQGTVTASTPTGTVISNTASVTSTTPDPTGPNTATASVTVTTQADLSVTIADSPDPVGVGRALTYQVVVTNGGPSDATNPTLSVALDPTLRFTSVLSPGGWTCTTPAVGLAGTVACHATSIAKGASAAFTIVTSVHSSSSAITTSATTASSVSDPNPANNSASATTATIAISTAIPTLSEWAFIAMAAMLLAVGVRRLRARRSHAM